MNTLKKLLALLLILSLAIVLPACSSSDSGDAGEAISGISPIEPMSSRYQRRAVCGYGDIREMDVRASAEFSYAIAPGSPGTIGRKANLA